MRSIVIFATFFLVGACSSDPGTTQAAPTACYGNCCPTTNAQADMNACNEAYAWLETTPEKADYNPTQITSYRCVAPAKLGPDGKGIEDHMYPSYDCAQPRNENGPIAVPGSGTLVCCGHPLP